MSDDKKKEDLDLFNQLLDGEIDPKDEDGIKENDGPKFEDIDISDADELTVAFLKEAMELCDEMIELLVELEIDIFETENFSIFSQRIDRIMGTALTLEYKKIGDFCMLGKKVGRKAVDCTSLKIKRVALDILWDTVEILQKMIVEYKSKERVLASGINIEAFSKRLKWLINTIEKHVSQSKEKETGSTQTETTEKVMGQGSIDDLLASLGL